MRTYFTLVVFLLLLVVLVPCTWGGELEDQLVHAAAKGDVESVQALLQQGARINSADKDGNTALTLAAATGQAAVVKLLIAKGADVNSTDANGRSALADVNSRIKEGKPEASLFDVVFVPLNPDEKRQCEEIVGMLKSAGASLYVGTADQQLIQAAHNDDIQTVRALILKGAHVNATGKKGNTALMFAAFDGNEDVARLLIDKGARVDTRDDSGATALMLAAVNGKPALVKLLAEKGADVNAKDKAGRSVMDYAEGMECRKILEATGAK